MSEPLIINDSPRIESGREYYWKRTDGWKWDGKDRWWEIFVEFANGFNGGGGLFVYEKWRWNDSHSDNRILPRNLSFQESYDLVQQIVANLTTPEKPQQESEER